MKGRLDVRVSYEQQLTPGKGVWPYTYVLRSGGVYERPVGKAAIEVVVTDAKIVAVKSPANAQIEGNTVRWSLRNLKPAADVVLVLKNCLEVSSPTPAR